MTDNDTGGGYRPNRQHQQEQQQNQELEEEEEQQRRRRKQQEEGEEQASAATATTTCTPDGDSSAVPIRIVTSSHIAPTLQTYVNFFNQFRSEESNNNSSINSTSTTATTNIRLSVLSSFQELNYETIVDRKVQSNLYDGYVIPPMMIGDLYEQQGLASLDDEFRSSLVWDDLLPYYKHHVATYDNHIRSIPLLAGNQLLLLFRKDYLDTMNQPTPKTWSELTTVAAALHNQTFGGGGGENGTTTPIYGVCMGKMSEAACQKQRDLTGQPCNSLSMTYLGMALASMTQPLGNSTGWLFDDDTTITTSSDSNNINGMKPLLNGTLEQILIAMEEISQYGIPDELLLDSSVSLKYFEEGRCAMTITSNHPTELLQDENVGFVPIPGSNKIYNRDTGALDYCTKENCPYSTFRYNNFLGLVNRVPFGGHDMVAGGISTTATEHHREVIMDFFQFVLTTKLNISIVREQPMTFSELQSSPVEGYLEVMEELTSSENGAIPFRVPGAFSLLSELDSRVYDYLLGGNYSDTNRINVRKSVEESWGRHIRKQDNQFGAIPTSVFYEKSLGIFTSESSPDLYIGTVARYTGWSLGAISCFFSAYCAFWVWKNQQRRVIRASQPMFLYLVCLGTFLMAACIFPVGIEDDIATQQVVDISCMATLWLYSVGYVVIFCALFSKIWRVTQIFRNPTMKQPRIIVGTKDVLVPFSLLFGINFIVLMIWTITDPIKWYRYPVEESETEFGLVEEATYGTCDSNDYSLFLGIIVGVNLFVSLLVVIQAYECRRISTDYSEILWISGAFCIAVQVWLIGLPVLKLVGSEPFWSFITKTAVLFLTSTSTLLCLFIPKMMFLRKSYTKGLKAEYEEEVKLSLAKQRKSEKISTDYQEHTEGTDGHDHDDMHAQGDDSTRRHDDDSTRRISDDPIRIGLEPPSSTNPPKARNSGVVGIRILNSLVGDGEEVERMRSKMKKAEKRNKVLQDRLERLQDQLEHYLVAHSNNREDTVLRGRPEQGWISSSEGSHIS